MSWLLLAAVAWLVMRVEAGVRVARRAEFQVEAFLQAYWEERRRANMTWRELEAVKGAGLGSAPSEPRPVPAPTSPSGTALMMLLALALAVLPACVRPTATLPAPAGCAWPDLPLRVEVAPELSHQREVLDLAADAWSMALDEPAVVFVDQGGDVEVVDAPERHLVEATRRCVGGRVATRIALSPGLDVLEAYAFAGHGFGHALGVAHSTNEQSVMQPTLDAALLSGDPGPDFEERFYRVTESDAAAVRAVRR